MYYFAYGSCMRSKDFCRTMDGYGKKEYYQMLGKARLDNYRLAFNAYSSVRHGGVLDIEMYNGKQVIGILYELSDEAMKRVDIREGSKYKRILVKVSFGKQEIQAYTYVIKEKLPVRTNVEYSMIVYYAMREHHFPQEYIDDFVKLVRVSIYGSEENYFRYKAAKNKYELNERVL